MNKRKKMLKLLKAMIIVAVVCMCSMFCGVNTYAAGLNICNDGAGRELYEVWNEGDVSVWFIKVRTDKRFYDVTVYQDGESVQTIKSLGSIREQSVDGGIIAKIRLFDETISKLNSGKISIKIDGGAISEPIDYVKPSTKMEYPTNVYYKNGVLYATLPNSQNDKEIGYKICVDEKQNGEWVSTVKAMMNDEFDSGAQEFEVGFFFSGSTQYRLGIRTLSNNVSKCLDSDIVWVEADTAGNPITKDNIGKVVEPEDITTGGDTSSETPTEVSPETPVETPAETPATDTSVNGIAPGADGWYLYNNGAVDTSYSGLYCDPVYGWWLIDAGRVAFEYTGLYGDAQYGWWLIGGGAVAFDYTGLWGDPNYGWWLVGGGQVAFNYTGLWGDPNYGWWLIGGGTIAFDYNDLWGDPNYGWWKVFGGTIDFGYNGVYSSPMFGDWNVAGGAVVF